MGGYNLPSSCLLSVYPDYGVMTITGGSVGGSVGTTGSSMGGTSASVTPGSA